jgi:hypothetical protein
MRRVVLLLPWLLAACQFDVEVLYPADAAADAPDASADGVDGGSDAAADASGVVGPNLLADPGFENGGDAWTPYDAQLSTFPVLPKAGLKSLAVCKLDTGGSSDFSTYVDLYNDAPAELAPGTAFVVRVWVRGAPALGGLPGDVQLVLRERGGVSAKRDHVTTLAGVTTAWQLVELEAAITDGGRTGLSVIVQALGEPDGTCFLLDEAFAARKL